MRWMNNERLLTRVANLYFNEEKSQREIADKLRLSKSKVCRMIREAKLNGTVQVIIKSPLWVCNGLEEEFERLFQLREAIIVNDDGDENDNLISIGQAGADYLKRIVSPKDIIGISWGQTLLSLVNQLAPYETFGTKIVQLVGGLSNGTQNDQAAELTRRLGDILNGETYLLHCPAVVTSPQVKEGLIEDKNIRDVFELGIKSTIALFGIGAIESNSELFKSNTLSQLWYSYLKEKGAVGDVCMGFYDINGKPCCPELDNVVMGMSINDIKKIKTVVCIAQGESKAEAILGALKGNIPDVLITNKSTANKILQIVESSKRKQ